MNFYHRGTENTENNSNHKIQNPKFTTETRRTRRIIKITNHKSQNPKLKIYHGDTENTKINIFKIPDFPLCFSVFSVPPFYF